MANSSQDELIENSKIKLFEDKKLDASIFKATQDYNLKVRDKNVL